MMGINTTTEVLVASPCSRITMARSGMPPSRRSLAIGETTVRRYLDVLDGVFMARQLQPWHSSNLLKRQVKSPKVYLRDTGLLYAFSASGRPRIWLEHPRSGAS